MAEEDTALVLELAKEVQGHKEECEVFMSWSFEEILHHRMLPLPLRRSSLFAWKNVLWTWWATITIGYIFGGG